jgi:hypothetical protein
VSRDRRRDRIIPKGTTRRKPLLKELRDRLKAVGDTHARKTIRLFFQDEARVGRRNPFF